MSRCKTKQLKRLLLEGNQIIDCLNIENKDLQNRLIESKEAVHQLYQICANFAETEFNLHREINRLKEKNSFKSKLKRIFR